ncbi:hypothetical protein [uncultured Dokdonia sp.]|uniref:hypothetical protein n=1 Tax=uncultured Dokdonia sp. TaxID=575653 RepID=UPI0026054467|nr:hypothetical protein [uncultured Dokdonia sp.]
MKLLFIVLILINIPVFAQDGSDIWYVNSENIDNGIIGKVCHIDVYSKSFMGRAIDTIEINVKGKKVKFIEHRVDNGYNNWLRDQYLIALPIYRNSSMRLISSKIDSLDSKKIYVTSVVGYYRYDNPLDTITVINHDYLRKNVAAILLKN